MSISNNLKYAKNYLEDAITELEQIPETAEISELLDAVEALDRNYKNFCKECDLDYGEPIGTTYEEGISMEFYIEADWWHTISKALRKLRPPKEEEDV